MTEAPERIWAYPWTGKTNEGQWQTFEAVGSTLFVRADLSPSPEVVKELVEALRQAHEALLWCARDGRMASPLLHQYPAKWAAEVGAALAKLEGGK